jgi:hypothetical protein
MRTNDWEHTADVSNLLIFNHNDSQAASPLLKNQVSRASVEVTHLNIPFVETEVAVTGTFDMPIRWTADACGFQRISRSQQMRHPASHQRR